MIKNTTFNGITLPAISLYSETNDLETVRRLATKITGCVFHNSVIEYVRTLNNLKRLKKILQAKEIFLGLLLLLMAIASTLVVVKLNVSQTAPPEKSEAP